MKKMEVHYLDSSVLIAFSASFDQDDGCEKYWEDREDKDFLAPDFALDKEVSPIINHSRRDMLRLARAMDSEFDFGNLDDLAIDLKAFARTQISDPRSPVFDFIDENEGFFRDFVLKAKDVKDLRKKIRSEFKEPQNFVQDILSNDHDHIDLVKIDGRQQEYSRTRSKVQDVIEHEKEMDDFIYTGAIIICDDRGLDRCYFGTLDEDEFDEDNRGELEDIDDRVKVFIPEENYEVE